MSVVEIHPLRNMLAVLELGSLGKAAEKLHISQPALTKSIKRLEEQLGVRLFERGSRHERHAYAETLRAICPVCFFGMARRSRKSMPSSAASRTVTVAGPSVGARRAVSGDDRAALGTAAQAGNPSGLAGPDALFFAAIGRIRTRCRTLLNGSQRRSGLIRNWLFDDELVVIARPGTAIRLRRWNPRPCRPAPGCLPSTILSSAFA